MMLPMSVLAVGAMLAGYLGVGFTGKPFHTFLSPVFEQTFATAHAAGDVAGHAAGGLAGETPHAAGFLAEYGLMVLSGALAILSILAAYVIYVKQPWIAATVRATWPGAYDLLWNKYYVDEVYGRLVVTPLRAIGRMCFLLDEYLVDGLVSTVSFIPQALGYGVRPIQRGALQGYGLSMGVGLAIVVAVVLTW